MAVTNGGNIVDPTTATVTTTASSIVGDNPNRRLLILRNTDSSVSIFWGNSTVTASSTKKGMELKAGETISLSRVRSEIYGITASGSVAISVVEVV